MPHRWWGRAAHQHLPARRHGRLLLAGGRVDGLVVHHHTFVSVLVAAETYQGAEFATEQSGGVGPPPSKVRRTKV